MFKRKPPPNRSPKAPAPKPFIPRPAPLGARAKRASDTEKPKESAPAAPTEVPQSAPPSSQAAPPPPARRFIAPFLPPRAIPQAAETGKGSKRRAKKHNGAEPPASPSIEEHPEAAASVAAGDATPPPPDTAAPPFTPPQPVVVTKVEVSRVVTGPEPDAPCTNTLQLGRMFSRSTPAVGELRSASPDTLSFIPPRPAARAAPPLEITTQPEPSAPENPETALRGPAPVSRRILPPTIQTSSNGRRRPSQTADANAAPPTPETRSKAKRKKPSAEDNKTRRSLWNRCKGIVSRSRSDATSSAAPLELPDPPGDVAEPQSLPDSQRSDASVPSHADIGGREGSGRSAAPVCEKDPSPKELPARPPLARDAAGQTPSPTVPASVAETDMLPRRALVTGGGGFLGRAIVDRLLARGVKVRSYSRGAYPELARMGVDVVRGDIADAESVARACKDCDAVFHVAALAGVWGPYQDYHQVNVVGTKNVVEACRAAGVDRLVFTSSPSVVFDGRDTEGVNEAAPYPDRFHAAYPRSKALAEQLVLAANGKDLATVSLRPHLIWGPRDPHLVPRILLRAKKLRRIGGINKRVDSVYIDNAADAHVRAVQRLRPGSAVSGRTYFITNGEPRPLWDLVSAILATADLPPVSRNTSRAVARWTARLLEGVYGLFGFDSEPPLTRFVVKELTTAHWFDIRAARRDLGYQPCVSIDQGLSKLRDWLHGDGAFWLKALRIAPPTRAVKAPIRDPKKPAAEVLR